MIIRVISKNNTNDEEEQRKQELGKIKGNNPRKVLVLALNYDVK